MKFVIETGSESHTSSYASLQAKYHGGEFDGKYLYEVKGRKVSEEWNKGTHYRWAKTVYSIPEGTEIEIIGKAYGNNNLHRIYCLDSTSEVFEDYLAHIQGHDRGTFKGRLVLVRDILEEKARNLAMSQNEGF